jgi:flagellar basal-body rod protein FlgC
MNYDAILGVSAAGMSLEKLRTDVTALNLANAHTIVGAQGGYQPMTVVASVTPYATAVGAGSASGFAALVNATLRAPEQASVVPTNAQPMKVYEPTNPKADASGYIRYPGIDQVTEMTQMMVSVRAYQADVAAFNTSKTLALKALEIGDNQS